MTEHNSNIDFEHLIQDLASMYPFSIPEVVLTELVANSLDAKSEEIRIEYDKNSRILIVEDFGEGMSQNQFSEYHDFATTIKKRGTGIGFAGVGAKVSFNIAEKVITETKSISFQKGSSWHLKSAKNLIWEDYDNLKYLKHIGTRVEVHFTENKEISYFDENEFEKTLIIHFLPLFDLDFLDKYKNLKFYDDINFYINNKKIEKFYVEDKFNLKNTKKIILNNGIKKYGFAVFGISDKEYPISSDNNGIAMSVYGKVIKFDDMKQFIGSDVAPKIFGIAEIPDFIKYLNTSKTDFQRTRATSKEYAKYFEPLRQEYKSWLNEIGIKTTEIAPSEDAVKIEQEIKRIIADLPEINQLFGTSFKRKTLVENNIGEIPSSEVQGGEINFPDGEGTDLGGEEGPLDPGIENGVALSEDEKGIKNASPITRAKKSGLRINFSDESEREDLSWIEGNVIFINSSHPSYNKVSKNNVARKLHNIFSIAISIEKELKSQELLEENENIINKIMVAWGRL